MLVHRFLFSCREWLLPAREIWQDSMPTWKANQTGVGKGKGSLTDAGMARFQHLMATWKGNLTGVHGKARLVISRCYFSLWTQWICCSSCLVSTCYRSAMLLYCRRFISQNSMNCNNINQCMLYCSPFKEPRFASKCVPLKFCVRMHVTVRVNWVLASTGVCTRRACFQIGCKKQMNLDWTFVVAVAVGVVVVVESHIL